MNYKKKFIVLDLVVGLTPLLLEVRQGLAVKQIAEAGILRLRGAGRTEDEGSEEQPSAGTRKDVHLPMVLGWRAEATTCCPPSIIDLSRWRRRFE